MCEIEVTERVCVCIYRKMVKNTLNSPTKTVMLSPIVSL